jgi:hypothetical protein
VYTKNFLVLNISRNGPHRGLIVHGSMINEVQNAICESEIPRFLYITEQADASATKGKPMANQVLGIHHTGLLAILSFSGKLTGFEKLKTIYRIQ